MKRVIIKFILHVIAQVLLLAVFAWSVNMVSTSPNKSEYDALLTIIYVGFVFGCFGSIETYCHIKNMRSNKKK